MMTVFAVLGLAIGGAALALVSWPLLILNFVDGLAAPGEVRRRASNIPFGRDPRQRLDVYAGRSSAPAPVILFFYGGSWSSGEREDYAFAARALAERGFVVIIPDYRLVPRSPYPAFLEDGAAAVRWARDNVRHYGGDPDRIILAGHSAGAYIAIMLALDQKWLQAAGVPPSVIQSAIGLSGPYDFHPFTSAAAKLAFHGVPEPKTTQPINFVRADAPPLLLITGDDDKLVRPRNSIALARRIEELGGRATLKRYEGIGHATTLLALSRPLRSMVPVFADIEAFTAARAQPASR